MNKSLKPWKSLKTTKKSMKTIQTSLKTMDKLVKTKKLQIGKFSILVPKCRKYHANERF